MSAIGYQVEELQRKLKQLTGIESGLCRKARIKRNHVACALLMWARLKSLAEKKGQTIYQIKNKLLST